LITVMVLGLGLGVQTVSTAQEMSQDVPMEGGNAARTGVMPGPAPDLATGVAVRWRFASDEG
jgi:hypothetical protein